MAIKASCTVTLSCYRDTQSVTRYYKLQSSTASAPSKPTTKPPSGWSDSEPSYTSGSTNTLYFCDLTVFSDGTWSYSTVSKSSSYEAAKEAYNKAVAAGNTANSANNKVDNLEIGGRNLIILGKCTEGYRIVDSSVKDYAANGHQISEYFKIEPSAKYTLTSYDVAGPTNTNTYISMAWYTEDKTFINRPTGAYGAIRLIKQTYQSPNNAYYCRVSFPISLKDKIKFEKGNKSTDYSKAPEDVHDIQIEPSAPSDKTRLWYDTNSSLLKKYDDASGEWMVVNDASDGINSSAQAITAAYTSSIEKVKNGITSSVDAAVSRIDSNEKTIETLSSQIQQNAGAITATTNTVKSVTDSLSGYTTKVEIREWARFSNGVLELGKSSSNFNTKLSNTELGFYEIGKRIAFISNQELNITKARILDKMYIGDYLVDDDDDYGFIIM